MYSNKLGVLVARICQVYPNATASTLVVSAAAHCSASQASASSQPAAASPAPRGKRRPWSTHHPEPISKRVSSDPLILSPRPQASESKLTRCVNAILEKVSC
ncbi:hypothetical protein EYF80_004397 [Liparis tanakae]|uniref:Uncharacterized protein n=1 Tax=Liparis tanakae TaxID=230148 RepID=A0A4Z2J4T7_9TELE|nr:hypothetical protein EYF80_004397 [Liparis tanakae]